MASLSVLTILRTIKERGSISRTELQHITGLSWGTITNTTRDLLNRNLIREEGALSTKAGRKPVRLALNPSSHSLAGVEIGKEKICCQLLSLPGEVLGRSEMAFSEEEKAEEVLGRAGKMVAEMLQKNSGEGRLCLGVGVAAPGYVDVRRGVLKWASRMPSWKEVPVRDLMQAHVEPTVRVEHDPNCLALAERWFGAAGNAEHVLCLNLNDGVGMGILCEGEVFRGSQQFAGEFGHMTIDPEGPVCSCGDKGCVEAYCSVPAVRAAVAGMGEKQSQALRDIFAMRSPTASDLAKAAAAGDAAAREAFARFGKYLGIGIANLVDLFNPDLIVLAGPLAEAQAHFMEAVGAEVEKHACAHSNRQIMISRLGEDAMSMGACGAVLQSIFEVEPAGSSALLRA